MTEIATFPSSELNIYSVGRDSYYRLGAIRLPGSARQGPAKWYVGRFHFKITFAHLRRNARVYVSADTGDRTFAQIEFERVRTAAGTAIRASTYDLFNGKTIRVYAGDAAEIVFHNYLQDRGVHPGLLPIRLHVEQFGPAKVRKLLVYADSAIATTLRQPTPLAMTIAALDEPPTKGDKFRVIVTLTTRTADDVLEEVSVQPTYEDQVLRLMNPAPPRRFAPLRGSESRTFVFEALAPGRHRIDFTASSDINSARVALLVNVTPRSGSWADVQLWVGGVLLAAGVALISTMLSRRHQPRTSAG